MEIHFELGLIEGLHLNQSVMHFRGDSQQQQSCLLRLASSALHIFGTPINRSKNCTLLLRILVDLRDRKRMEHHPTKSDYYIAFRYCFAPETNKRDHWRSHLGGFLWMLPNFALRRTRTYTFLKQSTISLSYCAYIKSTSQRGSG